MVIVVGSAEHYAEKMQEHSEKSDMMICGWVYMIYVVIDYTIYHIAHSILPPSSV